MSNYTDAEWLTAINAAAKHRMPRHVSGELHTSDGCLIRDVLDAVAPAIAARAKAEALREAAIEWSHGLIGTDERESMFVAAALRDRADEIEAGQS